MDALVTVRYRCSDICDPSDLKETRITFDEMVRWLIQEEGVLRLCDAPGEIISIEQAP